MAKPYKPTNFIVRVGLIVWLDDCPPLDDDQEKRRPIVVVEPDVGGDFAIVIACSATAGVREIDAVALPNLSTQPQCMTGLPRPCDAIPRWFLPIAHSRLKACQYSGKLLGSPLRHLLMAYLKRRDAVEDDPDPSV